MNLHMTRVAGVVVNQGRLWATFHVCPKRHASTPKFTRYAYWYLLGARRHRRHRRHRRQRDHRLSGVRRQSKLLFAVTSLPSRKTNFCCTASPSLTSEVTAGNPKIITSRNAAQGEHRGGRLSQQD